MVSLFRQEVIENRQYRLDGSVLLSQPLSTHLLSFALFSIVGLAAVWLTFSTYARVETVPGILVTDKSSSKIMPLQNGIVAELAVQEGQMVAKGERLLVIDSDRTAGNGGRVAGRSLAAIEARRALSEAQIALTDSRAASERNRLTAVVSSSQAQSASLREQIELQEEVVASNKQIFNQVEAVVERGFVSKVEFERRRQTLLSSQQQLANLRQRLSASDAETEQAQLQLETVTIETAQGISRIRDGVQALAAEEARLDGEQGYVLTAPISGRVTALATGEGRATSSARPLMVIVPLKASLSAELYAPTRAVGFIKPGKETRLLYDAFPYQRFGSSLGRVSSISQIAVDPSDTDIPFPFEEPVYRIMVELDRQSVLAFGRDTPLQPGMTLQANVVLERQSFFDWLLQPLYAVLNRNS